MALQRYFLSIFIIFLGFLSFQINADGIASVNSYVEIKSSATDFRARKQSNNGQRSTSGFDFIITPERTNICQGLSNSICNSTYSFSGLGYVFINRKKSASILLISKSKQNLLTVA